MINVKIWSLPFALDGNYTRIEIEGQKDWFSSKNNRFYSYVVKKPIEEWLFPYSRRIFSWPGFLKAFVQEVNEREFSFQFVGLPSDYLFFVKELKLQAEDMNNDFKIFFAQPEVQDYKGAVQQMREILILICDVYSEGKAEMLKSISLRKKLEKENPPLVTKIFRHFDSMPVFFGSKQESDVPSMLCMIFDIGIESMSQMLERYIKSISGLSARDLLCCIVSKDKRQSQFFAEEFVSNLRERKILSPHIILCDSMETAEEESRLYLKEHYRTEIYLPKIFGQAAQFVSQLKARKYLPVENRWNILCRNLEGRN